MLAFLFLILAQLAPPPPRPTVLPRPRIVGTVTSVGTPRPWFNVPAVVVAGDDGSTSCWSVGRVTVRFRDRPGPDWSADYLLVGDRVVVVKDNDWWEDHPTVTVTTGRDPDLISILATERSVIRFRQQPWPPPVGVVPAGHAAAIKGLGSPCYFCRESASRRLTHLGGPSTVRALAWAERGRDAEVRHRAAVAIGCVLRGDR